MAKFGVFSISISENNFPFRALTFPDNFNLSATLSGKNGSNFCQLVTLLSKKNPSQFPVNPVTFKQNSV